MRNSDCAFDAMCIMAGAPRTEARRRELRFEAADYMWKLAENAALHRALSDCVELSIPTIVGTSSWQTTYHSSFVGASWRNLVTR